MTPEKPPIYKVWIEVEQQNDGGDGDCYSLDSHFSSSATFHTEQEAQRFARTLHDMAELFKHMPRPVSIE